MVLSQSHFVIACASEAQRTLVFIVQFATHIYACDWRSVDEGIPLRTDSSCLSWQVARLILSNTEIVPVVRVAT